MLNKKGYLGSIGDDLPSLIPLTFALLVFFASLGFTFNQFDLRQEKFDQKLLKLKIGSTLKGDSLINDYDQFETACRTLNITSFKFRAAIYNMGDYSSGYKRIKLFEDSEPEDVAEMIEFEGQPFLCANSDQSLFFTNLAAQQPENVMYPVAVNLDGDVKTGMLVVTVWR